MQDSVQPRLLERTGEAFDFFNHFAEELLRSFSPTRMLIIGPAIGLLIEALWDRGVEAWGEGLDTAAIEEARIDVKPFCSVGFGSAKKRDYDVVVCVDFLKWSDASRIDADLELLKQRARCVVFLTPGGDYDDSPKIFSFLDWIQRLNGMNLVPVTSFNVETADASTLLVQGDQVPLSAAHLVDFARMRKVTNTLVRTQAMERAAQEEARVAHSSRIDSEKAFEAERTRLNGQIAAVRGDEALLRARLENTLRYIEHAYVGMDGLQRVDGKSDEMATLRHQLDVARNDLQQVYWSSSWRLTRPVRAVARRAPGLAAALRNAAKLVNWTVTLQLPQRLRARREFRRSVHK